MCGGGGIAQIALPVLGAIAGGSFGGPALSSALDIGAGAGTAIGAGLGGAAGTAAAGGSLKDAALSGALTGAGGYAFNELAPMITGSGTSGVNTSTGLPVGDAGTIAGGGGPAAPGLAVAGAPGGEDWLSPIDMTSMEAAGTDPYAAITSTASGTMTQPQMGLDQLVLNAAQGGDGTYTTTDALGAEPGATDLSSNLPAVPGAGGGAAQQSMMQKIMSTLGIDKPGRLLIPAAGLGAAAVMNTGISKQEQAIKDMASRNDAQSQQLMTYLQTGTLPPGAQAGLDQGARAAKASIRSQYAGLGLSGSTMERDALANVDERVKAQGFSIAANLLQSGLKESELSGEMYNYLVRAQGARNTGLQSAIANFASASVGAPGGINLNINRG